MYVYTIMTEALPTYLGLVQDYYAICLDLGLQMLAECRALSDDKSPKFADRGKTSRENDNVHVPSKHKTFA